jgi:homoserine kinase type II
MALLTPLSVEAARAIGALFGLEVIDCTPIAHGSVNSNFMLALAGESRAFLRIYEESEAAAVAIQNRLVAHLVAQGVPTPAPLSRDDGTTIASHAGKAVCVFPYVEGAWLCQGRVTTAHLEAIGAVLGRIHRAGEGYADRPVDRFDVGALSRRLEGLRHQGLAADLASDVERLRAIVGALESPPPATTVIHGDLFRDNALWRADGTLAAVIDFESASAGHPSFDLMVTMLAWCFGDRLEEPLVRALVTGYCRERPLSPAELALCGPAARAAAARFAVTRITDYELRPRAVVAYKDYRRFLPRLEALDALGEAGLARWLAPRVAAGGRSW